MHQPFGKLFSWITTIRLPINWSGTWTSTCTRTRRARSRTSSCTTSYCRSSKHLYLVIISLKRNWILLKIEPLKLVNTYFHLLLRTTIIESFNGSANTFFNREFDFFNEITGVSGVIKSFEKGPQRTKACKDALKQVLDLSQNSYF